MLTCISCNQIVQYVSKGEKRLDIRNTMTKDVTGTMPFTSQGKFQHVSDYWKAKISGSSHRPSTCNTLHTVHDALIFMHIMAQQSVQYWSALGLALH